MSKRYKWINGETYCDSDQMYDNETGNKTQPVYVADLLNEQDQKIKDLEDKLSEMQNEKDELISKYRYWRGECAELKEQLAEHNEFFNAFNCKNFNEFKDFISTFMLTPHEEQTLIRELEQQLKDTEESYNNTMRYLNKTRSELLNLPKKIVGDIRDDMSKKLWKNK